MQVDCEVEVEVEEVLVVEVVQWEQEGSSVRLLLSMCPLVGLVDVAASEAVNALLICVYAVHRDLRHLPRYLHQVVHDEIVHEVAESQVDHDQEVVDRHLLLDRYGHDPNSQNRSFQEIQFREAVVCLVISLWGNSESQTRQMR